MLSSFAFKAALWRDWAFSCLVLCGIRVDYRKLGECYRHAGKSLSASASASCPRRVVQSCWRLQCGGVRNPCSLRSATNQGTSFDWLFCVNRRVFVCGIVLVPTRRHLCQLSYHHHFSIFPSSLLLLRHLLQLLLLAPFAPPVSHSFSFIFFIFKFSRLCQFYHFPCFHSFRCHAPSSRSLGFRVHSPNLPISHLGGLPGYKKKRW